MKLLAGVVLALAASLASGQVADFEARREAARADFLRELEDYGEWCRARSLFQERKRALDLVLTLDPAHEEARKALGYTKDKDGSWRPPAKAKAFRDFDKKALAEAEGRLTALRGRHLDALHVLLDEPRLSRAQREALAADALLLDPDDERVHRSLGDVKSEKGWVLPETLRARERREELRAIVRAGLEGAPSPVPAPLSELENRLALSLRALTTDKVRVVGTVEEEELRLMTAALHGLQHVMQAALRASYPLPRDCTVFLLADPAQRDALLEHHPAIAPASRALYQAMEGAGIQGTADFAFWTGDAQRRIDGVVRLVLGYLLTGSYDITADQGWIYEGLGLVLTRSLVRTRLTWLAQPARLLGQEEDFKLRQRLLDPETNWVDEAYKLLLEERQPPLPKLLRKGANELTTEDLLYSYALATYLLEAQAEHVPEILMRVGTGLPGARVLEELLGMDLADLERHLRRWLSERT